MAGTVEALLLNPSEHGRVRAALPLAPLVPETELALLPLSDEIVASVMTTAVDGVLVAGFYNLTSGVAEWARQLSLQGVVAYLHAEFFGGDGSHAAVAWRGGAVAWGPLFTATSADEAEARYTVVSNRIDMAINVLLRWLGVRRMGEIDEFAAAGLNRCRWTEEWATLTSR
ncbi:hypothetical protein [Phytohabitans kaempferiae]|uniref:Uncharacterized protein n=1 Tax=Phytohabitans kaempferiae TaxID=1620943 RepID=A0ABV6LY52_9ACTN